MTTVFKTTMPDAGAEAPGQSRLSLVGLTREKLREAE